MKKIIFCIVLIVSMYSINATAQDKGQDRAAFKQTVKDSLKITDAIADSVIAIQQKYRPQIMELRKNKTLSEDDKKAKTGALKTQQKTDLKRILTTEQLSKLEAIEDNMRDKMKHKNAQPSSPQKQ
ncbi:MAG: hypothetical protein ABI921_08675 [Panacibacter sp.]